MYIELSHYYVGSSVKLIFINPFFTWRFFPREQAKREI
jgi:hypothetical protein